RYPILGSAFRTVAGAQTTAKAVETAKAAKKEFPRRATLRRSMLATLLTVFVALEHLGFLVLEMFFWTQPLGQKVFKTTPSFALESRVLAANQGLYNGFLAAGLVYGLLATDPKIRPAFLVFTLTCVVVAGIF